MIRQRRRGEWNDLSSPPSLGGSSGDKEWNECQTFDKKVQVRGNVNRVNTIIFLFFHVASVLVVAVGIVWTWRDLYTSQECDMTWSRREFLEIELPVLNWHGVRVPKYKLFKFMDQRDPRHSSFLSRQRSISIEDKSWCLQQQVQNIPIVLYIPGHFGSYEQSRSLGAHGLQLTGRTSDNTVEKRILQKLNDLTTNKSTMSAMNISTDSKSIPADIADFFYDVFAVDFGEEGGAFHGALLERQSFFIAQVVQSLARTCGLEEIHIVAHSIGGVSARLASSTYKTEMMSVRNIVTLGTPHAAGVLSWDPSMSSVYNRLNAQSGIPTDQALLVSISGGLRDEMIPPRLCNAGPAANRLSLLSTQIMRPAAVEGKDSPPNLGMDHRAVVWCHNLLSEVRVILFILSTTTDYSDVESRATLLTHSLLGHDKLSHSDFNEAILQLRTNLKVCLMCLPILGSIKRRKL